MFEFLNFQMGERKARWKRAEGSKSSCCIAKRKSPKSEASWELKQPRSNPESSRDFRFSILSRGAMPHVASRKPSISSEKPLWLSCAVNKALNWERNSRVFRNFASWDTILHWLRKRLMTGNGWIPGSSAMAQRLQIRTSDREAVIAYVWWQQKSQRDRSSIRR